MHQAHQNETRDYKLKEKISKQPRETEVTYKGITTRRIADFKPAKVAFRKQRKNMSVDKFI